MILRNTNTRVFFFSSSRFFFFLLFLSFFRFFFPFLVRDVVVQAQLEIMQNKVKLSDQRSQLLETKAEKILHDKTARPTGKTRLRRKIVSMTCVGFDSITDSWYFFCASLPLLSA